VCRHVYTASDALFFLIDVLPLLLLTPVTEIPVSLSSPLPAVVPTHEYTMAVALVPPAEQGAASEPPSHPGSNNSTYCVRGLTSIILFLFFFFLNTMYNLFKACQNAWAPIQWSCAET